MRALLTYGTLLIVLSVVALSVRHQMHADKRSLPSAPGVPTPLGTSSSPTPAQFRAELDKALSTGAAQRAEQAASAEDGAR